MKFLVMVYGNDAIWGDPSVDFAALVADVDRFNAELQASGEMVAVDGLESRPHAVRVAGGQPVVSDGPYLEAAEYVGSYFVLDVADEARALELASSYPGLRHGTRGGGLEVWPLMTHGAPPA
ncbi:YciI family protein [Nakamurella leprariae]|uniref:YCII-related domain-containing protein n=1 Tax=Nakamurella leprariae TaxID=2803911 RepID=A0A938YER7_9ACTN|nr:YciI family protein [Nakamurella leprariae]MBM9469367.1 hypothetical protein [Nakamurella leprariae]